MKKLFRRVTAAVVCAVMLLTVMPLSTATVSAASSTAPLMAIVPLDNRPVCVDRVIYAAESAGFEVAMPAEDLYRTYLDNQGKNANGTQHGDGAAIMTWLENMDRNEGCDYYVIHLDQMFSGGLVGSRYPDTPMPSSVTVSDAGVLTATELDVMNRLVALASKADNHVYFVDTVMRLASTGSYKGYEVPAYNSFREYAQKTRKVLSTSNFDETEYSKSLDSIKQIYNNYQIGSSGETLTFRTTTDSNYQGLTQKQINEYHFFRLRKLMLINRMAQYGAGTGVYIIGVDDASPKVTIQTNEINFIEARMTALGYEYYLSADTDSCGLMAVARCANDYYSATPRIRVRYYGGMADKAADSYDIGTLRTNVQTHVESLNATYIDEKTNSAMEADVEVLVLTKISDSHNIRDNGASSEYTGNIDSLVSRAKSNIKNNIPTIIIDASTEMNYFKSWVKGLKNLQDELIANVDMSRILGYSNWNTVGNSIGIALGMGIARYAYVKYEVNPTAASHVAFAKSLTYAYVKDIAYNARNKNQDYTWTFQYWITNKAGTSGKGWNNGNFYTSMRNWWDSAWWSEHGVASQAGNAGAYYVSYHLEQSIMHNTETKYADCANKILNNLKNGEMYTSLNRSVQTAKIGSIGLSNFRCPWYRQFEITFDIAPTMSSTVKAYYEKDASFLRLVPVKQNASTLISNAKSQYGASTVVVRNTAGTTVSNSTMVGTGFSVTMTISGSSSTHAVVIPAEVDGDGQISTTDVRQVVQYVLGVTSFSDAQKEAADVDANAKISSSDARQILQLALRQ